MKVEEACLVGRSCVLTFHRILDDCERDHDVTPTAFRSLVDLVARTSTVATQLDPAVLTEHTCVLTFDDGTADHLIVGDYLANRGIPGVFFIATSKLETPGYLTARDVRRLRDMGHVIGSHLMTHVPANQLKAQQLIEEIRVSKQILENLVAEEVVLLAPPGGVTTRSLPVLARDGGYSCLRLMRWGIYRSASQQWRVPCIPVTRFTLRRGWVNRSVETMELRTTMEMAWLAKCALPTILTSTARTALNRRTAPSPRIGVGRA